MPAFTGAVSIVGSRFEGVGNLRPFKGTFHKRADSFDVQSENKKPPELKYPSGLTR
jgi:hypothetical protein